MIAKGRSECHGVQKELGTSNSLELLMPCGCRYGPFWIATTLIFVTAAAGNFSSYIAWKQQHEGEAVSGVNPGQWFADTTKVRLSSRDGMRHVATT